MVLIGFLWPTSIAPAVLQQQFSMILSTIAAATAATPNCNNIPLFPLNDTIPQ